MRQHTRYGQRIDLPPFSDKCHEDASTSDSHADSCFLAGCTDADVEGAEQALGCTYSDATNYNATAAIGDVHW